MCAAFDQVGTLDERLFICAEAQLKPTVLVATTSRWIPTARLAMALANAGCAVDAVCPPHHPIGKTRAVRQTHRYRGLAPLASFADAIATTKPDLVFPCDDLATMHLHDLYQRGRRQGKGGELLCALIERSLGAAESFPVVYARTAVMELAQQEGIRAPKTKIITNNDELKKWADQMGFPMMLKTNGTSGGEGVKIVHTLQEAERTYAALEAPPLLARTIKRALIDQDMRLVWPTLLRRRSVVNAQEFIAGREATSLVACWKGTVLAALHFEVLNKQESAGPATVVRLIEQDEMSTATERMVRRLNLSGLQGFDFMLEACTGNAYLIEINPRATQVGHLALGPGRDLPGALHAAIAGGSIQEVPKLTENKTIALFPQEWLRDPASSLLQSAYHDVPWEEPELIRECVRRHWHWSAWCFQKKWIEAYSAARLDQL